MAAMHRTRGGATTNIAHRPGDVQQWQVSQNRNTISCITKKAKMLGEAELTHRTGGGGQLHDALSNCPPPKSKKVRKTRTHARTKLGRRSTTCFPRSPPSCSATGRQRLAQPRTTGATLNSPSARYHCRSRGHPLVAAVKTQSRQIQEVKSYKNAPNKNFQATGICRISQDGNPALVSRVRLFSRKRKEEQPRKAIMPNTVLPS